MLKYILVRPHNTIIKFIIWTNVLVFVLWSSASSNRDSFIFMAENFLISWNHLADGHYWTLLTAFFSHNMFFHIFLNMYVLYGFGVTLEGILGARRFLIFYMAAGLFASVCHALVCKFLIGHPELPALGASGAITGVIMLYALMFPKRKILILGIIPVPALTGALLFVGLDIWGLVAQSTGGGLPIGHGAHLGGSIFGFIYYFLISKPKDPYIVEI